MNMDRDKVLGKVEVSGLSLVVVAACVWIMSHSTGGVLMAVGTVLLAVGRFAQTPFYQKYSVRDPKELTLRRLYHQRVWGAVFLILATMLMLLPMGFYWGVYVTSTSWLIFFILFVIVEVYTVFRVSSVEKG